MSEEHSHIAGLVQQTLDEIETLPVPGTVRRALRIATLRGDDVYVVRFSMELRVGDTDAMVAAAQSDPVAEEGVTSYFRGRSRRVNAGDLGVPDAAAFLQQSLDRYQVAVEGGHEVDGLALTSQLEKANRAKVGRDILETVRADTFDYLLHCELALRLSAIGEEVFDAHRRLVEERLSAVAPQVLSKLTAAHNRSVEGDAEAGSQALLSCRRVLVAVADLVFPASGEPYIDGQGQEREVGEQQYRNRIVAFVEQSSSGSYGAALVSAIEDFAVRLDRLDELTQKGVHAEPTQEEVDFGVVQTYLLAGEVLGLHPATGDEDGN